MNDAFTRSFQNESRDPSEQQQQQQGWLPWILQKCGVDFK